jgi:hypothetical protein
MRSAARFHRCCFSSLLFFSLFFASTFRALGGSLPRPQSLELPVRRALFARTRRECELKSGKEAAAKREQQPLASAQTTVETTDGDDANERHREKLNRKKLVQTINSVMLVGWGGNNGSTVTAGILANKL